MDAHTLFQTGAPLVLLVAAAPLDAQRPPANDTLLARLTAEAIAANAGLSSRTATARAAEYRIRPAGTLPDPMLTTGVANLILPRFALRESDFTEIDLELSQEFPWPGTLGARARAAEATARARRAEVSSLRRDVRARIAELYYRLRYVVSARTSLEAQRALLETAVEIATTRYATGKVPQGDPLQARVARSRLEAEAAALIAEEAGLRANLKALRNVRGPDSVEVEPIALATVDSLLQQEGPLHTPPSGADTVLQAHPRLQAREAAVEAAEQLIREERLAGRPEFSVMTRYGARPLGSDFFSAFLGLRLPLWAGRKQHRLADAARAEADAARASLEDEKASLRAELDRTLAQARAGKTRLELLTNRVVPAAEATVEAAVQSYRVGQVEFLNVLAVEDALYRAQLEVAQVAAEHLIHLVMLEQLVGREDES